MMRSSPPFRADHVGSLLRPEALKAARAGFERGEITQGELTAVEDAAIEQVIARQEAAGLQGITDGELRRQMWHWDFLKHLPGVDLRAHDSGVAFSNDVKVKPLALHVTGKVGFSPDHPLLDHFRFLKARTSRTAKMTIPSPSMLFAVSRDWRALTNREVYPELEDSFPDIAAAYQAAIRAFYDAGCRYLQLDEVNLSVLCDAAHRQRAAARGDDPDRLAAAFVELINASLEGRPKDLTISMHTCRGNFRSTWQAEGGYEPVADMVFKRAKVDAVFAEYDTERAGGFEPLRAASDDKILVLGLFSSKAGALEDAATIKRRVDEAARHIDRERLCVSPQCGFASSEEGNVLSEEEQWAKLAFIRQVADEIWA